MDERWEIDLLISWYRCLWDEKYISSVHIRLHAYELSSDVDVSHVFFARTPFWISLKAMPIKDLEETHIYAIFTFLDRFDPLNYSTQI